MVLGVLSEILGALREMSAYVSGIAYEARRLDRDIGFTGIATLKYRMEKLIEHFSDLKKMSTLVYRYATDYKLIPIVNFATRMLSRFDEMEKIARSALANLSRKPPDYEAAKKDLEALQRTANDVYEELGKAITAIEESIESLMEKLKKLTLS